MYIVEVEIDNDTRSALGERVTKLKGVVFDFLYLLKNCLEIGSIVHYLHLGSWNTTLIISAS